MWVAIDYRCKNWVAVLTSLGSTVIVYARPDAHVPTITTLDKSKHIAVLN
jgi:hypothetical protein